jgi:hypothetical protein
VDFNLSEHAKHFSSLIGLLVWSPIISLRWRAKEADILFTIMASSVNSGFLEVRLAATDLQTAVRTREVRAKTTQTSSTRQPNKRKRIQEQEDQRKVDRLQRNPMQKLYAC